MAKNSQKPISTSAGSSGGGIIIGKFMPPHAGHKYLVDFARHYVDDLTVLVCTLANEPIPGELRHKWMRAMFPDVNVVHVTDENPQEPHEHEDFWNIWKKTIKKRMPKNTKYLFASESYGWKLAEVLGLQFIPLNENRDILPVSGTKIRKNPFKYWKYIPEVVRPYFVKRICIFGPESTGKTTLTRNLAKHFKTISVNEYARDLLDYYKGDVKYEHIDLIGKGHKASEEALVKQANKTLFVDTDCITTVIWSKVLFKKCPEWIEKWSFEKDYDLYLLTDVDVPWIKDEQRYLPTRRKWFFNLCIKELKKRNKKFVLISGSWKNRLKTAIDAVDSLVK